MLFYFSLIYAHHVFDKMLLWILINFMLFYFNFIYAHHVFDKMLLILINFILFYFSFTAFLSFKAETGNRKNKKSFETGSKNKILLGLVLIVILFLLLKFCHCCCSSTIEGTLKLFHLLVHLWFISNATIVNVWMKDFLRKII
jgi:hypothetical protein